jgi:hypothetical protein
MTREGTRLMTREGTRLMTDRSSSGTEALRRVRKIISDNAVPIATINGGYHRLDLRMDEYQALVEALSGGAAQGGIAPLYARYIEVLAHLQTAWGDNGGNAKINSEMLLVLEEAGRLVHGGVAQAVEVTPAQPSDDCACGGGDISGHDTACPYYPLGIAQRQPEPAMWVCLVTPKGEHEEPHIRAWTTSAERAKRFAQLEGLEMRPLYASPVPSTPDAAAQAAPEPLDYGDELLRWSNIEVALRKKFPTLNATGIEIDNWPALIDALAMSSTD